MRKLILPIIIFLFLFGVMALGIAHDSGLFITQTNGPSAGAIKFGMGFAKTNPEIIYVDRYKSTDSGNTWVELNLPTPGAVSNIAVEPENPNTVYLASSNELYKSSNGGVSWEKLRNFGTDDSVISAMEIDPENSNKIFVGNTHGNLFFSNNAGSSWADISPAVNVKSPISKIAVNPEDEREVYVATGLWYMSSLVSRAKMGEGLFKSTDGGVTFKKLQNEFSGALVQDVDLMGDIVYATAHYSPDSSREWFGAYRSENAGISWEKIFDSKQKEVAKITHLAANPSNPQHIVLSGADEKSFFVSYDGGRNWKAAKDTEPVQYTHELEFAGNDSIFAVGYYRPFLKSTDGGETWRWSASGIKRSTITSLELHPTNRNAVLAGTFDGAIHITYDGGKTWDRFFDGDYAGSYAASIKFDPADWGKLYIGVSGPIDTTTGRYYGAPWKDTGLYVSDDAGKRWVKVEDFQLEVYDILIHPDNLNVILIGTASEGIYRSEDGGKTWKESNSGISKEGFYWNLNLEPEGYTPADECKERYEKYKRGEKIQPGCFYFATRTTMGLFLNPHDDNEIWYTTLNGAFVSRDLGKTWGWVSDDLKNIHLHFMAFDPSDKNVIYLGTHQGAIGEGGKVISSSKGLYISRDGGKTWKQVASGPGQGRDVRAIAVNPENPNLVVVGTDDPLFISEDKGRTWQRVAVDGDLLREADDIRIDGTAKVIYLGTAQAGVWRGIIDYDASSPALIEITGVHFPQTIEAGKQFNVIVSVDNIGSESGSLSLAVKLGPEEFRGQITLAAADQDSLMFPAKIKKAGTYGVAVNDLSFGQIEVAKEEAGVVKKGVDAVKDLVKAVFIIIFFLVAFFTARKIYNFVRKK